jgi:hypothetical protein
MAGADLFREKSTAGWFVLREKYCWLVADKPNEQAANLKQAKSNSGRWNKFHPLYEVIGVE